MPNVTGPASGVLDLVKIVLDVVAKRTSNTFDDDLSDGLSAVQKSPLVVEWLDSMYEKYFGGDEPVFGASGELEIDDLGMIDLDKRLDNSPNLCPCDEDDCEH